MVADISEQQQLVVFEVANNYFGLDISTVQEIIRPQNIADMPEAPGYVKGIINLRGKVIPIIDLRQKFGLGEKETSSTRVIVVDVSDATIGLVVDAVNEVLMIKAEQVEAPSSIIESYEGYLSGIARQEERLILLLDLAKLVPEAHQLKEVA